MREIKFRAWDKGTTVSNILGTPISYVVPAGMKDFLSSWGREEANTLDFSWLDEWDKSRYVIMQYTGLNDKDGKEIYEGDIVKYKDGEFDVLWCNGGFKLMERKSAVSGARDGWMNGLWPACRCDAKSNQNIEVIGNIYENQD
jgi:uncharacterized phage protein (TIGR01671 family)